MSRFVMLLYNSLAILEFLCFFVCVSELKFTESLTLRLLAWSVWPLDIRYCGLGMPTPCTKYSRIKP